MEKSRSANFIGRGCEKKRQRQVLINAEDAATLSLWGFVTDDYKKLMRLAFAHQRCMRGALNFGRSCDVARQILGGNMTLIVQVAEWMEKMPRGVIHDPQMIEEVACTIATAEAPASA